MDYFLTSYPFLADPINIAAGVALLVLMVAAFFLQARKPWLARIRSKPLLTGNETEFFHRLQRALPAYQVFPQVSFGAPLTRRRQALPECPLIDSRKVRPKDR
jgi:hypothetical protein